MKILFANFHPTDPQVVKNLAQRLLIKGHKVLFTVIEKENIINEIIKSYNFPSVVIGKSKKSIIGKIINTLFIDIKLFFVVRKYEPDIIFSPASPYTGHISRLLNVPQICWGDTETAIVNLKHSLPFLDCLLLPDCFYQEVISNKIIKFKGYKELAYLHPNWFKPNNNVLKQLNLTINDKIVLMRFSAMNALHDIGLESESNNKKNKILLYIKELEKYAKIYISVTEKSLGKKFEKYKLIIHPSDYTNLLSFCSLYIGEGTTTASEAGALGIPWINIHKKDRGYLIDQEENYELGFCTSNLDHAFEKAIEWIQVKDIREAWAMKREKLFKDKIDVSKFLIWFIENYPKSHRIMIENPDYQNRFR